MSEKMIARWNAIPLDRPEESSSLKRRRNEDQQDSDDDISLISRSPSPRPGDAMDVDQKSLGKYDEYHHGSAREVITVETKLKSTNKGFELLSKFGWKEGQPVGLDPEGRTEPVPFYVKSDLTGLGKVSQDVEMIETTVSQRRGLDSERQQRETEEQRRAREDIVARKSALEAEISSTLRAFYCELCDKQFKNVAQYDEHTNSYAHHHKVRYRDMQANIRIKPQAEIDKRKEKERKREEKELRKIAAAQGIKMAKVPASSTTATVEPVQPTKSTLPVMDIDAAPAEPKKGWATILNPPESTTSSGSGFRNSGWATVGSSSLAPPPPSDPAPPPPPSEAPPAPPSNSMPSQTPSFRNAGWTTLDTASAPPKPSQAPNPSLPGGNSWSQVGASSNQPTSGSWSRSSFVSAQAPLCPPLPDSTARPALTSSTPGFAPVLIPQNPSTSASEPPPVRSNWQQFQKGAGRRK
ncbi:hypothetical protein CPB83DRAFT_20011 [Crepidotus variabilis]|uniref:G-patch domain-containing protein n=1 Tax=Crepidotus variabilis TaxID=179855 RepID=A0A9P6EUG1_9AGAR|nr:hypothetical protein CPB83DRAFT_20011 [Crepidotus variabilis]